MAYAFNDDKTKAEVYSKSETYSKTEVYKKSEAMAKSDIVISTAAAPAKGTPNTIYIQIK